MPPKTIVHCGVRSKIRLISCGPLSRGNPPHPTNLLPRPPFKRRRYGIRPVKSREWRLRLPDHHRSIRHLPCRHSQMTGNEEKEKEEQQHPRFSRCQALSEEDWVEAEEAIESSVWALSFTLQIRHDASAVRSPLAAMQHCLLAALIRTSTLPGETFCCPS